MQYGQPVRLPESFRGGCSFGAGDASNPGWNRVDQKLPVSPDVAVEKSSFEPLATALI